MSRKKRGATPKRKGRRVSGLVPKRYQSDTNLMIGVAVGLLVGRAVPGIIQKIMPGTNPKVSNAVQIGAGVVAAAMFPRSPLVRGAGVGVAAMAAVDLATNLGLMPGADGQVSGDEVIMSLDEMGYGMPRNLVAGVGANYTDKSYVNNVIAGVQGYV